MTAVNTWWKGGGGNHFYSQRIVEGEQVYSQWTLKDPSPGTEP